MRSLAIKLSLALMGPLVMLLGMELVLWIAGVTPMAGERLYKGMADERSCRFGWAVAPELCALESVPRRESVRLVVTLGGSSVFGYKIDRPFPLTLHRELAQRRPGQYRVINRGLFCRDSIYVRDCALVVLRSKPDWLVVYTGHNDFSNWGVENPGLWIWLEENAWIYELDTMLARTRFYSFLSRPTLPDNESLISHSAPHPSDTVEPRRTTLAKLEQNLEVIVDAARRRGTRVALLTVVSNLWEFPYRRVGWDKAPPASEDSPGLVVWKRHYLAGIAADRARDYAGALQAFKLARDAFQHGRAHSETNELLRRFARDHSDVVVLVDFAKELEELAAPEGIGCNFFGEEGVYCDQFHPNMRTHNLIAQRLAEELTAREKQPLSLQGW